MNEYLTVATVLKPQGIRGEIKVMPQTDSADDIKSLPFVMIDGTRYKVLSCRTAGGFAYLALSGIADRNAAELLRGKDIKVSREEAPKLPEGRVYIADVVGCMVLADDGTDLGEVTDVTPAHTDIYTVASKGKKIMFPAADGVILSIDIALRTVTVSKKRFEEVVVN